MAVRVAPAGAGVGDVDWAIGISAERAVERGGRRDSQRDQRELGLERVGTGRRGIERLIDQRVRIAMHAAGASRAGIGLADDGLAASLANLEIVENAYGTGAVSIIDLLDAQTQALVAEQIAANARYDALLDFVEVQRAMGWFLLTASDVEQVAFLARAALWFEENGQ